MCSVQNNKRGGYLLVVAGLMYSFVAWHGRQADFWVEGLACIVAGAAVLIRAKRA